uniref:(California timema) hypothetical protein n=1 Tax=Timema californicum TaxID=61474 RepID=A0A7R9IWP0_TIMCA|nr:unnamed protein product [Timema californicum]
MANVKPENERLLTVGSLDKDSPTSIVFQVLLKEYYWSLGELSTKLNLIITSELTSQRVELPVKVRLAGETFAGTCMMSRFVTWGELLYYYRYTIFLVLTMLAVMAGTLYAPQESIFMNTSCSPGRLMSLRSPFAEGDPVYGDPRLYQTSPNIQRTAETWLDTKSRTLDTWLVAVKTWLIPKSHRPGHLVSRLTSLRAGPISAFFDSPFVVDELFIACQFSLHYERRCEQVGHGTCANSGDTISYNVSPWGKTKTSSVLDKRTEGRHPPTFIDGFEGGHHTHVERFNRDLNIALTIFHHQDHSRWDQHIDLLNIAFNAVFHESFKATPSSIFLNRDLNHLLLANWDFDPLLNYAGDRPSEEKCELAFEKFQSSAADKSLAKLAYKWSGSWSIDRFLTPVSVMLKEVAGPSLVHRAHFSIHCELWYEQVGQETCAESGNTTKNMIKLNGGVTLRSNRETTSQKGCKAQGTPLGPEGPYDNNNNRRLLTIRHPQNGVFRKQQKTLTNWSPVS